MRRSLSFVFGLASFLQADSTWTHYGADAAGTRSSMI